MTMAHATQGFLDGLVSVIVDSWVNDMSVQMVVASYMHFFGGSWLI